MVIVIAGGVLQTLSNSDPTGTYSEDSTQYPPSRIGRF